MEETSGNRNNIAFTVELFMLFGIMLLVIVVITQTLVMARSRSLEARHLTEAVIAAENTMEIISSSEDDPAAGLRNADLFSGVTGEDDRIDCETVFDGENESGETYLISVGISKEPGSEGTLTVYEIKTSLKGEGKVLYKLKTATYERGNE